MICCGDTTLPSDFDILRPCSSTTKPCVSTASYGAARACRRRRAATTGTSRGTDRCLRGRGPPATSSSGRLASTASWLDPESNHTSRMSRSRSNAVPPHDSQAKPSGTKRSSGASYHASALSLSNTGAACSTIAGVSTDVPHVWQCSAGIGTPQARWREMHQSGRLTNMPGHPLAAPRRDPAHRVRLGHRGVAQRVHADEPLRRRQEDHRLVAPPAVRIRVLEVGAMPEPPRPRRAPPRRPGSPRTPSARRRGRPRARTARRVRSARRCRGRTARRSAKSSLPWPGAVCTAPVPCSSVTWSPSIAERVAIVQRMPELHALEERALERRDLLARAGGPSSSRSARRAAPRR